MKLLNADNVLLKHVFTMLLDDSLAGNIYSGQNWAFQMKSIMDSLGFSHIWNNHAQSDIPLNEIKQRILDQTDQEILRSNGNSTKLQTYCLFKFDTKRESYLDSISVNKFRYALSRSRLSSHNLAIETGRYYNIPKEDRICIFCNMFKKESEYHFLLVCPFYTELRRKYFTPYYYRRPCLTKFKSWMQSNSEGAINRPSKFIYHAQNKINLTV